ncbi:Uncharacterised protein [Vibrio cholerae]|nr:Uncharacterised protein [Vibrio cholerae]
MLATCNSKSFGYINAGTAGATCSTCLMFATKVCHSSKLSE